jgi:hypothetical protein
MVCSICGTDNQYLYLPAPKGLMDHAFQINTFVEYPRYQALGTKPSGTSIFTVSPACEIT